MNDVNQTDTSQNRVSGRPTNRRRVLQGIGTIGLGGSFVGLGQASGKKPGSRGRGNKPHEIPISTQFYSYAENSDLSVAELIRESANAGYDAVEPFMLDDVDEIADALEATGLELSSAHVSIGELEENFDETIETYSALGADALIHAYEAGGTWQSEESVIEWAERVNEMADRVADEGLEFGYHNHDHEFVELDGTYAFDIFAEHINENVHIQLDVGWTLVGGANPVSVLNRHSESIRTIHMKDMTADGAFTEIGEGDVNMKAVANVARAAADVDYLIYEYDAAPDPIDSLYTGAEFLERWNGPCDRGGAPFEGRPPRVVPGAEGLGAEPPSDATILWDGDEATLDGWQHYPDGRDAEWIEHGEYFEVNLGTGDIQPEEALGDCHLHLEWRVPEGLEGEGQGPGNSGVFMMETYEFQVLQSYDNHTYPSGYAGSYYLANEDGDGDAPLVLPIRPPGEWQEYDIIWRGPRFEDGEVVRLPQMTLFFNGVAVQVHNDIPGPNWWMDIHEFDHEDYGHPQDDDGAFLEEVPFNLQDHGGDQDEVHFRNIWYRDLPEDPVEIDGPDEMPAYDTDGGGWVQPEQINPGGFGTTGDAPEDAELLIDGGDLSAWESADGGDVGWSDGGDYVEVAPGAGDIQTRSSFGDAQFHVEYRIPEDVEGDGPDRGSSGVLMMGEYEIQIVDTHANPVEPEDWVGAYVDQAGPHHDAARSPGEWQQLDIVWQGPRFEDGEVQPAQVTALLNGVAVQTRLLVDGPNAGGAIGEYEEHPSELPLRLQEDGSRVQFRNTWARSLD
ncbi:family 16 glycoside hydrolase (plasmid) [Haloferacaceae archaeon DSL9]